MTADLSSAAPQRATLPDAKAGGGDTARQVRVARQPGRILSLEDFEIVEVPLGRPGSGEVLVRNHWMSVDPYIRLSLSALDGLHASKRPGDVLDGAAVGTVEQSNDPSLPAGALVASNFGWRDRFIAPAAQLNPLPADVAPANWYLGILGLTGLTAWAGIECTLKPTAGETILISGAAGAVGSVACQLAKARGARVLGTAGSADKIEWLLGELGVDSAVNYKTDDVPAFLARQAADGLDCYFDNVGGPMLDDVLQAMKVEGRIGLCGAIAQYETDNYRQGPKQFFTIIEKALTVIGFNASQVRPQAGVILPQLTALAKAGVINTRETVYEGIDSAPAALLALFTGENTGKLVVRL